MTWKAWCVSLLDEGGEVEGSLGVAFVVVEGAAVAFLLVLQPGLLLRLVADGQEGFTFGLDGGGHDGGAFVDKLFDFGHVRLLG